MAAPSGRIDTTGLSLTAWELATGETRFTSPRSTAAVSRDTISRITDKVIEEMIGWHNRSLDQLPGLFIDVIMVKSPCS